MTILTGSWENSIWGFTGIDGNEKWLVYIIVYWDILRFSIESTKLVDLLAKISDDWIPKVCDFLSNGAFHREGWLVAYCLLQIWVIYDWCIDTLRCGRAKRSRGFGVSVLASELNVSLLGFSVFVF